MNCFQTQWSLHMYGKIQSKIGEKWAITPVGDDIDSVFARAIEITQSLEI